MSALTPSRKKRHRRDLELIAAQSLSNAYHVNLTVTQFALELREGINVLLGKTKKPKRR